MVQAGSLEAEFLRFQATGFWSIAKFQHRAKFRKY
jgi:hypothetical protein